MNTKKRTVLFTTFMLFFLLFNSPFITLPNEKAGGLPSVMIYMAVCWIALIIWMRTIPTKKEND